MLGLFNEKYPIQDCITNADDIWEDISKVAFYLKQGLTLSDIGEAFKYIGDAVVKIPLVLQNCQNCEGIIQEFKVLKDLFSDPITFLEKSGLNILWHFRDITSDITEAQNAWITSNFLDFGKFIGMMIKITTQVNQHQQALSSQTLLSVSN